MTPSFHLIVTLPAILIAFCIGPAAAAENDLSRAYRVIASKRFVGGWQPHGPSGVRDESGVRQR